MMRVSVLIALALMLVLAPGRPCSAGDPAVGGKVADAIDRLWKRVDKGLKRVSKLQRDGKKSKEARRVLLEVIKDLRAGVRATHSIVGKKAPAMPNTKPTESPPTSAGKPTARPTQRAPDGSGQSAYALTKSFDRFTGDASVSVAVARIAARHMDSGAKAVILLKYLAVRNDGQAPAYSFFIGSDGVELAKPRERAQAYFLVDGERMRKSLPASFSNLDGTPLQQVVLDLDDAWRGKLLSALKVEMRIGGYDFALPVAYRKAALAANLALDRLGK